MLKKPRDLKTNKRDKNPYSTLVIVIVMFMTVIIISILFYCFMYSYPLIHFL